MLIGRILEVLLAAELAILLLGVVVFFACIVLPVSLRIEVKVAEHLLSIFLSGSQIGEAILIFSLIAILITIATTLLLIFSLG